MFWKYFLLLQNWKCFLLYWPQKNMFSFFVIPNTRNYEKWLSSKQMERAMFSCFWGLHFFMILKIFYKTKLIQDLYQTQFTLFPMFFHETNRTYSTIWYIWDMYVGVKNVILAMWKALESWHALWDTIQYDKRFWLPSLDTNYFQMRWSKG